MTRLLDAGLEHPPALRCALTGGGPVPAALVARARAAGVPVSLTYGLTEACSQVTTAPVAGSTTRSTRGPALRRAAAVLHARAHIASTEGEILVAGPTVAPGSLDGDGWLRTGDLGVIDEDGRLHVTGRKADTIVSGGENVAPAEVEAVLEAHPDVLEAAVLGRADPHWGEAVTAIVVVRPGAVLERRRCAPTAPAASLPIRSPSRCRSPREPLPRTRSGKLLRRARELRAIR